MKFILFLFAFLSGTHAIANSYDCNVVKVYPLIGFEKIASFEVPGGFGGTNQIDVNVDGYEYRIDCGRSPPESEPEYHCSVRNPEFPFYYLAGASGENTHLLTTYLIPDAEQATYVDVLCGKYSEWDSSYHLSKRFRKEGSAP